MIRKQVLSKDELQRLEAGFAGEIKLKQTLSDYFFKTDHHIFYNFECMNEKGYSHQMDAILVTPFFIVIFEVKLLSGVLFYKSAQHEFYRIHNDKRENFRNPLIKFTGISYFWNNVCENGRSLSPCIFRS